MNTRAVVWEKIKAPLIFVFVALLAAVALQSVQNTKDDFDKRQKAPLVVVDAESSLIKEKSEIKFVRAAKTDDLIGKIAETWNGEQAADQKEVLARSLSEIKYQNFKNEDELINALNEIVLRRKDNEIKNLEYQRDAAWRSASGIYAKQESMKALWDNKLKTTLTDYKGGELVCFIQRSLGANIKTTVTECSTPVAENISNNSAAAKASKPIDSVDVTIVKSFLQENPSAAPLFNNFLKKFGASNQTDVSYEKLRAEIDQQFKTDIDYYDDTARYLQARIEAVGEKKYEPIFKSVYTTLKSRDKLFPLYENGKIRGVEALENSAKPDAAAQTKNSPAPRPLNKTTELRNRLEALFLNDRSSLNVVYKLLAVTLTAIVVFALLYVILIPLRNVFFLTTYADSLSDQAKKFLERKDGASDPAASIGLGRAVVATLAAVGIGTAVIAANPFAGSNYYRSTTPGVDGLDDSIAGGNTAGGVSGLRGGTGGIGGIGGETPKLPDNDALAKLSDNITSLSSSVNNLQQQVAALSFKSGVPGDGKTELTVDTRPIAAEIANLKKQIPSLEGINKKIDDLNKSVSGKSSDPNQPGEQGTVIGQLRDVTELIGGKPKDTPNLLGSITGLQTQLETLNTTTLRNFPNTVEGINRNVGNVETAVKAVNQTADSISATTTDLRRSYLGKDGRNILTRTKSLFTGERYQVTKFACEALAAFIPRDVLDEKLQCELKGEAMSKMRTASQEMSKKQLLEKLKLRPECADEELWKEWKRAIQRYTRVPRY